MELRRIVQIQLSIILTIAILYFAKPVLMPLAIAGMFALVFMPLTQWLERKGCHTVVASLLCGLLFALLVCGVVLFVFWHVQHIAADFSDIRQHFTDYLREFRRYLHDQFGMGKIAGMMVGVVISLVINLLLILVYMIMLLCLRQQVRAFILKLAPPESRGKTEIVINRSANVVQQYLRGLAIVIGFLWIMYSIGFSLVGVHTPIFFAILCGLLEIIPFVGNITGSTLTCLMALSQGGGFNMVFGVLITYILIQSIQFYIISPLVMQTQVSIHPLFTIVVLFAGDLVWGIPGMILAIPALGIVKIICDHIEVLQPFGHLLGENRPSKRWWG